MLGNSSLKLTFSIINQHTYEIFTQFTQNNNTNSKLLIIVSKYFL